MVSVIEMKPDAPQSSKKLSLREKLNAKKVAKQIKAQNKNAEQVQKSIEDLALE